MQAAGILEGGLTFWVPAAAQADRIELLSLFTWMMEGSLSCQPLARCTCEDLHNPSAASSYGEGRRISPLQMRKIGLLLVLAEMERVKTTTK